MAFTVNDLQDLIALLAEKPEWRAQLRPLILGEELEHVPGAVQELTDAQRATQAQLAELAAMTQRLVEAQERTGARIDSLLERVDRLADSVDALVARTDRSETRLDAWDGFWSQSLFRQNVRHYFGELVRRARAVTPEEAGADDALDAGRISEGELRLLDALDIVVLGKSKLEPGSDLVLAVEISRTIDYSNVGRAAERAAIFRKVGIPARGAVGGVRINERVRQFADERDVFVKLAPAAEMPK